MQCRQVLRAVRALLGSCSSCFPDDNLTAAQRHELERLSADASVIVTPVDKGGKWMIVPRDEYDEEGFRQLADKKFYRPIDSPLTTSCLLYTSPSPRDLSTSRMPSSA